MTLSWTAKLRAIVRETNLSCPRVPGLWTKPSRRTWLTRVILAAASVWLGMHGVTACRREHPPVEPTGPGGPPTAARLTVEDLCGLSTDQFGSMEEEAFRNWFHERYGRFPARDEQIVGGEAMTVYSWRQDGAVGNAFAHDGRLHSLSIIDIADGPSFGDVVTALGTPKAVDRYANVYDPVLYRIQLDYPDLGVSVTTKGLEDRTELSANGGLYIRLAEEMPVTTITCYAPSSLEHLLLQVLFLDEEVAALQLARRIDWPGFGESIRLDNR